MASTAGARSTRQSRRSPRSQRSQRIERDLCAFVSSCPSWPPRRVVAASSSSQQLPDLDDVGLYCAAGASLTNLSRKGRASSCRPAASSSVPRLNSVSKSFGASATARFQCSNASPGAPACIATTPRPLCARAERGSIATARSSAFFASIRLPRCSSSVPMFSSACTFDGFSSSARRNTAPDRSGLAGTRVGDAERVQRVRIGRRLRGDRLEQRDGVGRASGFRQVGPQLRRHTRLDRIGVEGAFQRPDRPRASPSCHCRNARFR